MAFTITTVIVEDGTGTPRTTYVASDGTNFFPVTMISDGTNIAAVKAASTAPAATDPAAVVVLSPNGNQALEAGGNLATIANSQGAGGTGINQPTGASGLLGWLSGIYNRLFGISTVSTVAQGSMTGLLTAVGPTNYTHSTNNSTTAQLASGATFTGVLESIFNAQQVSILLACDQPTLLTLYQYVDAGGVSLTGTITRIIPANSGLQESITLNGNYFKVSLQNTGAGATTTLNLDIAYGSIDPVNSQGQKNVAVQASVLPTNAAQESGGNLAQIATNTLNTPPGVSDTSAMAVQGITGGVPLPVSGTFTLSNAAQETGGNLAALASTINATNTSDAPQFVAITGNPTGDFAGQDLLELALGDNTGIGFNTRLLNQFGRVDSQGALIPSDAPNGTQTYYFSGSNQQVIIDTQGYQSVLFYTTNGLQGNVTTGPDQSNWVTPIGATPPGALINGFVGASVMAVFPCTGRYFRFIVQTGPGILIVQLRQVPFSSGNYLNAPVNIGQVSGANISSIGSTANTPLMVGGGDANNLARRLLVDTTGALQVLTNGQDWTSTTRRIQTDLQGNLITNTAPGNPANQSVNELLYQILMMQRVMAHYLFEEPGLTGPRPSSDEPDNLVAEFMNNSVTPNSQN